jgi:hypothetical protein
MGDRLGEVPAFVASGVVALVPLVLLPRWTASAASSSAEPAR